MPVDRLKDARKTARGMTETPRGTGHTNTNRRNWETGGQALDDDVVGGQQKQS